MKKIFLLLLSSICLFANVTWQEEASERMNWYEAKKYCKNKGFELPSKKEFEKVWHKHDKSSNIQGFELSISYWTKDEVKDNYQAAYPFYFMEGRDTWYYKTDKYGVRCISR